VADGQGERQQVNLAADTSGYPKVWNFKVHRKMEVTQHNMAEAALRLSADTNADADADAGHTCRSG